MNYRALIENRKSVRSFTDKKVPVYTMAELRSFFQSSAKRLVPGIKTELRILVTMPRRPWRAPQATISSWLAPPSIWFCSAKSIPLPT